MPDIEQESSVKKLDEAVWEAWLDKNRREDHAGSRKQMKVMLVLLAATGITAAVILLRQ